ncbi:hypothetical protein XALC_0928 [Xanthomonas albilineans GPE PC73]|uniref:Transposase n=1 Tax=Xanthomonas albilineans (strain GPE PC73 / CFBP 7063) TaxID=380358 RepID=D2UD12_XANAP|nr:hypothetical protein XALC_0928 [Xanthomonas albilineans GPE PC73]
MNRISPLAIFYLFGLPKVIRTDNGYDACFNAYGFPALPHARTERVLATHLSRGAISSCLAAHPARSGLDCIHLMAW